MYGAVKHYRYVSTVGFKNKMGCMCYRYAGPPGLNDTFRLLPVLCIPTHGPRGEPLRVDA